MKTFLRKIFALAGFFHVATAASAQDFALNWFTLDSGGGTSTGGVFAVSGAITQPSADAMSGGNFSLTGEFLTLMPAVAPTGAGTTSFIGPSPYLAFDNTLPGAGGAISPFAGMGFSYFHLETFEDRLLNTPGVTNIGGVVISGSGLLDSVDADDGAINGSGPGSSFFSAGGASGIRFNFDASVLGALPTRAGIVWTDGAGELTFQAFGPGDVLLGGIGPTNQPGIFPDNSNSGTTGEDRFFGVIHAGGISSILIMNSLGGIEVDHLQYGVATTKTEGQRITAVSVSGTELRFSFPANSGQSYVIESRADLASGAWAEVPGTTRIGNGTAQQLVLPISMAQPQQFYRVKIVP